MEFKTQHVFYLVCAYILSGCASSLPEPIIYEYVQQLTKHDKQYHIFTWKIEGRDINRLIRIRFKSKLNLKKYIIGKHLIPTTFVYVCDLGKGYSYPSDQAIYYRDESIWRTKNVLVKEADGYYQYSSFFKPVVVGRTSTDINHKDKLCFGITVTDMVRKYESNVIEFILPQ